MSGFMNSSNGDSGRSNDRSARHVMINQIMGIEPVDDAYELDGKPLKNALIVGIVSDVQTQNSRASVEIGDGTGSISVTIWNVNDENPIDVRIGKYASMYIELRDYQGKTRYSASHVIQPISFLQVLFHEVCALKEHCTNTGKKAGNGATSAPASKVEEFGNDMFGDSERLMHDITSLLTTEAGQTMEFLSRQLNIAKEKISTALHELDNTGTTWNNGEQWFLTAD